MVFPVIWDADPCTLIPPNGVSFIAPMPPFNWQTLYLSIGISFTKFDNVDYSNLPNGVGQDQTLFSRPFDYIPGELDTGINYLYSNNYLAWESGDAKLSKNSFAIGIKSNGCYRDYTDSGQYFWGIANGPNSDCSIIETTGEKAYIQRLSPSKNVDIYTISGSKEIEVGYSSGNFDFNYFERAPMIHLKDCWKWAVWNTLGGITDPDWPIFTLKYEIANRGAANQSGRFSYQVLELDWSTIPIQQTKMRKMVYAATNFSGDYTTNWFDLNLSGQPLPIPNALYIKTPFRRSWTRIHCFRGTATLV